MNHLLNPSLWLFKNFNDLLLSLKKINHMERKGPIKCVKGENGVWEQLNPWADRYICGSFDVSLNRALS